MNYFDFNYQSRIPALLHHPFKCMIYLDSDGFRETYKEEEERKIKLQYG